MAKPDQAVEGTKRLMGALVRMKPKPHEDMKLGNRDRAAPKRTKAKKKK